VQAKPVEQAPQQAQVAAPAQVFGRASRERVSLGLDFYWNTNSAFRNDYAEDTSDHTARTTLTLAPYIGIRTSDLFELRPAIVYTLNTNKRSYTPNESPSGTIMLKQYSFSEARLGFDMGFMFYLVHGSFFRFAVGPALGYNMSLGPTTTYAYTDPSRDTSITHNTYIDINIPIHVPFCFDFVPTKHLGFRLSSEIFNLTPNIHYVKDNGDNATDASAITTNTTLDLAKIITELSIGVFLLF
jgi:hypothetical protein